MIAFHVYSPLELLLICCYFNETVPYLRTYNKGLWLGSAGLCFGIINSMMFQPVNTLNSAFLFFESVCIISLSLVAYGSMIGKDSAPVRYSVHFWVTTSLLIYWAFCLVEWGMYLMLREVASAYNILLYLLWVFNLAFYAVIATVFILYPKMSPSHGRE